MPPNVFYGADIQYLDLHNNKINSIAEKAFDGHNALKYLYLHKNKLKIIPINTFKVLDNLKFLSLDKNSLGSKEQYIFPTYAGVEFYPQGVPTLKSVVAQGLAKELEDKNLNEVIKIMQRIPLDQLDALFKAASAKTQAIMSQALQIISAQGYIRYRDVIETKKKGRGGVETKKSLLKK